MHKHTLEVTIKNFKHATDLLASTVSENKQNYYQAMQNVHVLTAHIIVAKITIMKTKCQTAKRNGKL